MHDYGNTPFLCEFKGCDRATTGNGFPRQRYLKDHMRRVHGCVPGQELRGLCPPQNIIVGSIADESQQLAAPQFQPNLLPLGLAI